MDFDFGFYIGLEYKRYMAGREIEVYYESPFRAYHYTSFTGLNGILSEDGIPEFWFTRFDALNDMTEGYDILDIYESVLNEMLESNQITKAFYEIVKDIIPNNQYFFSWAHRQDETKVNYSSLLPGCAYLCCFSSDRDSLPMWNYYCKDGKYSAYSIGIETDCFSNNTTANDRGYILKLFKVVYDNDKKRDIICRFLKEMYESYEDVSPVDKKCIENSIRNCIIDFINTYRYAFKKNCFSHENEYRAVIIIASGDYPSECKPCHFDIKYREVHGFIVPYIVFKWKDCRITEIVIGPSEEGDNSRMMKKQILNEFLLNKGWRISSIGLSDIPVRY